MAKSCDTSSLDTTAPPRGSAVTMSAARSCSSASRTGVRETPNSVISRSSSTGSPGSNAPQRICDSMLFRIRSLAFMRIFYFIL